MSSTVFGASVGNYLHKTTKTETPFFGGTDMRKSASRQPSLDLYRTFAVVLREGSLSAAARALGVQQSSVTRHIDALEGATGTRLFVRSSRGLVPTDRALALRPIAQDLLQATAALHRGISGGEEEVVGSVRVSAGELVAVEHLPGIVAALRGSHPGIAIEIVATNEVDDLAGYRADIAVRMVDQVREGLVSHKCPAIGFGLYAHADYLRRRGVPGSLDGLRDHDMIGFDADAVQARHLVELVPALARNGTSLRTDSHTVQFAAVRAGCGIGICQSVLARRHPALVHVLAEEFAWELPVWIVMHERIRARARCQVVFNALIEGFANPT